MCRFSGQVVIQEIVLPPQLRSSSLAVSALRGAGWPAGACCGAAPGTRRRPAISTHQEGQIEQAAGDELRHADRGSMSASGDEDATMIGHHDEQRDDEHRERRQDDGEPPGQPVALAQPVGDQQRDHQVDHQEDHDSGVVLGGAERGEPAGHEVRQQLQRRRSAARRPAASSRTSCRVGRALALRARGPASREENGRLSATAMTCSASAICPTYSDREQHVGPDAEPQPQPPGRPDGRAGHAQHGQHARRRNRRRSRWPACAAHSQPESRKIRNSNAVSSTARELVDDADDDGALGAEHPFGEAGEEGERAGDVDVEDRVEREEVAPDQGQPAAVLERRQTVGDVRDTRTCPRRWTTACRARWPAPA